MSDENSTLTQERLHALLRYEPTTGHFHWRYPRSGVQFSRPAGSVNKTHGYVVIGLDGRQFYGHRLAWLYVKGEWPLEIDHKDGNRANNRIDNLRDVPHQANAQNKPLTTCSATGFRGVTPHGDVFEARIKTAGKETYIGRFPTIEEASAAYLDKRRELHIGHIE
jgi:hypothetical protein